ncbi:MAG: glycosyltransferase family 2 protein [Chthoniobacterales bacterium]
MDFTASSPELQFTETEKASAVTLSVIMPCLNEAETLVSCIRKARRSFEELGVSGEVVIADNGSTDGSQALAIAAGARVIAVEAKGYGNALRAGIEAAEGQWIIMGDSDDSYDFSKIAPFINALSEGYELVMGCRMPRGKGTIEKGAMPWKHRWIGNPVLSFIGKLFFKSAVNDFHCGLRGFSKRGYEKMALCTAGMEFASEMVIKSTLQGLKITEVPITLHKDGRSRPPHLRSWRDGWRHLRFMLLFCPLWLFLVPGAALTGGGFLAGLRLLFGPIKIGPAGFDTNTLLVCAMAVVIGLQLSLFAIFARVFAVTQGLMPPSQRLKTIVKKVSLESGLLSGIAMGVMGFAWLVHALMQWRSVGYGALSYPESLRQVIPAVTLLTTGTQIFFSSFFMGILGLSRHPQRAGGLS